MATVPDQLPLIDGDDDYDVSLSQWYTRKELARRVVKWALKGVREPIHIIEPSAGNGALIEPIPARHHITAIDIDPRRCKHLRTIAKINGVRCYDYLQRWTDERWDLAIMNPPYESDQDVAHCTKAVQNDADRVVAILKLPTLQGLGKWKLWERVRITRMAICVMRQPFDGPGKDSPRDGTMVVELVAREQIGRFGVPNACTMEWWG